MIIPNLQKNTVTELLISISHYRVNTLKIENTDGGK